MKAPATAARQWPGYRNLSTGLDDGETPSAAILFKGESAGVRRAFIESEREEKPS
jgi:hypothetical protein